MMSNKKRRKGKYKFAWDGEYVPNDLICDVILGEDISYFACTGTHKVFLPIRDGKFIFVKTIENGSVKYILRDVYSKKQFYIKTAEYLDKMEKDWEKHRGEKYQNLTDGNVKTSKNMDFSDNLNYGGKLLSQKLSTEYIVVYNEGGNIIRSCVLDTPVIVEHKAFYAYFSSKGEAYYVCGILNSDQLLNRLNKLGILSERGIGKKPFEIFFPRYDKTNDLHQKISELTIKISDKAKSNESYDEDKVILDKYVEQLLTSHYD